MLRAINDKVLVEEIKQKASVTPGGIHLITDPNITFGIVQSVGSKVTDVVVGNRVAYHAYAAITINDNVSQLRESDILGVDS